MEIETNKEWYEMDAYELEAVEKRKLSWQIASAVTFWFIVALLLSKFIGHMATVKLEPKPDKPPVAVVQKFVPAPVVQPVKKLSLYERVFGKHTKDEQGR